MKKYCSVLINYLPIVMLVILTSGPVFAQAGVVLEESGPIYVEQDGQVIENLRITSWGSPAIIVRNFANVTIRNVEISHDGAYGIQCANAPGLRIENVSITHVGVKTATYNENNINCELSSGLIIRHVLLRGGSSGIYLANSPDAHLSFIEGYNFRGPSPRGQFVQFNGSDNCILEDFSVINDRLESHPEDNVSIYNSHNCIVRRGLVDGNNAPSGVGVMFEKSSNGLVEDVDTVRMGNGSFAGYPGYNVTFRRVRARENICTDQGRGLPMSGGLVWAGNPDSSGLRIEDSRYFDLCNQYAKVWDKASFDIVDITSEDFALRPAIVNKFAWETEEAPAQTEPALEPAPAPEPAPDQTQQDTVPPSVQFAAPLDGSTYRRRSLVKITIMAADDHRVTGVSLSINGRRVARFSGAGPHNFNWKARQRRGTPATISAEATDGSGNSGSASITINVTR